MNVIYTTIDSKTDQTRTASLDILRNANIRRAVVAATVGTLIEWYDYALYGAASGLIISKLFFPQLSQINGVLAAFATFAVGFFARPLGGVVISHIGDRYGRKPALIFTISLMGGATMAMGFLPTFAQAGIVAPILLVLLRLLQGFGAGAELAGAITLVAEYAPPARRAFYTAIPNAATVGGIMLATLVFLAISSAPDEALFTWVWRIPFLLSGLLFVVALYIRNRLDETPEYVAAMAKMNERHSERKVPISELVKNSPKELFFGFLAVTGHNANAYILGAFALSYMTNTLGMTRTDGLLIVSISVFFGIVGAPLMGVLADRIGSAKVFMAGAAFAFVMAFPLFQLLDTKNFAYATLGMSLAYGISFGCMAGAQGAFLANLFPARYRFSGIAIARELNGVVIAGPTPFIAAALVAYAGGRPTLVAVFVMACSALTIVSVWAIKHLSKHTT
ncbi:MAG TPA: MFS transporter [Polaromonas sp.]|uniref:MFS transporter n=1 Tax=Polaromonas sp. UBA4122 TaxID=1947074 RepID=UPI000EBC82D1|nr:MFS transporter [Polaromonas sp. UBA4122]HAL38515.1 MFS transporter [Polaromonas sp.]